MIRFPLYITELEKLQKIIIIKIIRKLECLLCKEKPQPMDCLMWNEGEDGDMYDRGIGNL